MNPYRVPGLTRPNGPLCPFNVPDHEKYYVPVDNTQKAFEQFQEQISGDLRLLSTEGRLVVVSGEEHCGKTTLINRCAAWLQGRLKDAGLQGHIFPLADEGTDNSSVDTRIIHVFDFMIDDLRRLRLLGEDQLTELADRRDNLDRAFRYLSDILDNNRVLIVLLPPSKDLIKAEVVKYANFSRGKIVFFAESTSVDIVRRHWRSMQNAGRVSPILLKVGPLNENDGWLFADKRQEIHGGQPDVGPFRKVNSDTMRDVTQGWTTSVGQLQELLYGYYHEMSVQPPRNNALPPDDVTFDDIAKYYFRFTRNETRYDG